MICWILLTIGLKLHSPDSKIEGVVFLSSQSYEGLGKPSAGCCAEIFFHNHSFLVTDGPIEPHSVVSVIYIAVILMSLIIFLYKSEKLGVK